MPRRAVVGPVTQSTTPEAPRTRTERRRPMVGGQAIETLAAKVRGNRPPGAAFQAMEFLASPPAHHRVPAIGVRARGRCSTAWGVRPHHDKCGCADRSSLLGG